VVFLRFNSPLAHKMVVEEAAEPPLRWLRRSRSDRLETRPRVLGSGASSGLDCPAVQCAWSRVFGCRPRSGVSLSGRLVHWPQHL